MFKRMIRRYITRKLLSDNFKWRLIGDINRKVDIPKLTEKQEKELFSAIYNAVVEFIA